MAKNILQGSLNQAIGRIAVVATDPATPKSGQVCRFGVICGVAEGDMDTANSLPASLTTLILDCIFEVSVHGANGGGNVAVTAGDQLYRTDGQVDGNSDPMLDKVTTGTPCGIAFGSKVSAGGTDTRTGTLVSSGATTVIRVLLKGKA